MKKQPAGRREGKDVEEKEFEKDLLKGDLHKNSQCLSDPPL